MRQRISKQILVRDTGSPHSHAAHAHLLPLPNTPGVASQMRQRISERVQAGDIDAALELTRQLAPGLLEGNRRIHFRLQCQKFAEMVGARCFLCAESGGWPQVESPVEGHTWQGQKCAEMVGVGLFWPGMLWGRAEQAQAAAPVSSLSLSFQVYPVLAPPSASTGAIWMDGWCLKCMVFLQALSEAARRSPFNTHA